jgi:hypothetical protein
MIKSDPAFPALRLPVTPVSESKIPPRLIVLIPDAEADYSPVMQRIWELARSLQSRVLFLGLCRDETEEPRLRRALVTMSALLQDNWVSTEAKVELGTNWLKAIKSNWQVGDVIACFAGQQVGFAHRPLRQILESNLKATVYVLEGLYLSSPSRSNWLSTVLVWIVSLSIIAGFFWIQVEITQLHDELARSILLGTTLLLELGSLWGWNSMFS